MSKLFRYLHTSLRFSTIRVVLCFPVLNHTAAYYECYTIAFDLAWICVSMWGFVCLYLDTTFYFGNLYLFLWLYGLFAIEITCLRRLLKYNSYRRYIMYFNHIFYKFFAGFLFVLSFTIVATERSSFFNWHKLCTDVNWNEYTSPSLAAGFPDVQLIQTLKSFL